MPDIPVFHHLFGRCMGGVIVLLQHPIGDAIGREHLLPTRQKSVLQNMFVLPSGDVLGLLPLLICINGLLL